MNSMRTTCLTLLILFATAYVSASAGEGFLAKIPEPGTWVKYHRSQTNSRHGQVTQEFSGSLVVRFLNEVSDKDVPCRWIEFELELIPTQGARIREINKYLVPVAALNADVDLAPKVVRAWSKQDDSEATGIESLPDFLTAVDLTPPLSDRKTRAERHSFDYQRGQLISLEQVSGTSITNAEKSPKVVIRHEINLQKYVPNGAAGVRFDIEIRRRDNDGLIQNVIMEHSVVDFGTDAASSLPESK